MIVSIVPIVTIVTIDTIGTIKKGEPPSGFSSYII